MDTTRTTKLFLVLGLLVAAASLLFWFQFKRARAIVIEGAPGPLVSADTYIIAAESTDASLGNPGAPLTIIEFIDLGDETSIALHQSLAAFVDAHPKDARLVWKDFPSKKLFSTDTTLLHAAAWCAGQQNKFWPFVTAVIKTKPASSLSTLKKVSGELSLNSTEWEYCLTAPTTAEHLAASVASGHSVGVSDAPALFVNNKKISLTAGVDIPQMLTTFIAP